MRLSLVAAAHAALIPVMDWSLNYGYCKAKSDLTRRAELSPVTAYAGDILDFRFSKSADAGQDVLEYSDEDSWDKCDASNAQLVKDIHGKTSRSGGRHAGGGCYQSHEFDCLAKNAGFQVRVGSELKTRYFASSGRHCVGGVKLRVDVLETRAGPDAVVEREILVPAWTDDWGYCEEPYKSSKVHRPSGLATIYAFEGDTLVFKYSKHHNVYLAWRPGAYQNCDKALMTLIADVDEGGNCENDHSLGPYQDRFVKEEMLTAGGVSKFDDTCIADSAGFSYKLSLTDPYGVASRADMVDGWGATLPTVADGQISLFFVCQIHDHCENGQRVVVHVLPRPSVYEREDEIGAVAITLAVVMFCGACVYVARKRLPDFLEAPASPFGKKPAGTKQDSIPDPFPAGVAEGSGNPFPAGTGAPQLALAEPERV